MKKPDKEQLHGILGTMVVHVIVLIILLSVVMKRPPQQQESGVSVLMGNVLSAAGDAFDYTEVTAAQQQSEVSTTVPDSPLSAEEPLITQTEEATVSLPDAEKDTEESKKPEKTPEELEQERLAREAERKRQEAERIAREADAKIAGAFGKGTTMKNSGDAEEGSGNQGSVESNETSGVSIGIGGYGTFDLNGRSLGKSGLPRPEYNVQDEGRVVVNITVNPEGEVIAATINRRTNTTNAQMRKAAIDAARKAVFNKVGTVDNQMGTITYYFKLR